jgi:hypothetical protein
MVKWVNIELKRSFLHIVWMFGIELHSNNLNLGIDQLSSYGFIHNIFVYYHWPYDRNIYVLHFYYRDANRRACYKLQIRNIN